jgi:hypothetical protein
MKFLSISSSKLLFVRIYKPCGCAEPLIPSAAFEVEVRPREQERNIPGFNSKITLLIDECKAIDIFFLSSHSQLSCIGISESSPQQTRLSVKRMSSVPWEVASACKCVAFPSSHYSFTLLRTA